MKILTRLGAALASTLLLAFLHTASPTAAQWYGRTGQIGAVTLNGPMLTGYDGQRPGLGGTYLTVKNFEATGITVGSSPAYPGPQDVLAIYVLQRVINGQWTNLTQSPMYQGRVTGAGRWRFPAWTYSSMTQNRFSYRFIYYITWGVADTGTVLGSTFVVPDSTGENRCQIRYGTHCVPYTHSIWF